MSTITPKRRRRKPRLPRTVEESNTFTYKLARYDEHGWADASEFKPIPYDILYLRTESGRIVKGWWAEFFFDGYRLKPDDKVLKWKKCMSQWGWDD